MSERRCVDEITTGSEPKTTVTISGESGRAADTAAPAKVSRARSSTSWDTWTRKRKIGRLKVSRSIPAKIVWNLTDAWWFAAQVLGLDFNLFFTVRPKIINSLTPTQRIKFFEDIRNKIAQFARDHDFECVLIWSRESDPGTGLNEHLHALTHIPHDLRAAFRRTAAGWFNDPDEIDTRSATYRIRWTKRGKQRDAIGYITKNSPQAAYGRPREYRKGGPILGKRVGCSRNIDAAARARYEARRAIQREFGVRAAASMLREQPMASLRPLKRD